MTQQWARVGSQSLRRWGLLALLAALVVFPGFGAAGQEEPAINRLYNTMLFAQPSLPALVQLALALDVLPDAHAALLNAPREFLATQTLALPVVLAADEFQITALDFSVRPDDAAENWFGVAAPLEGLVFEPKGVGIFYRSVGIFLQAAHEPGLGEMPGGASMRSASSEEPVKDLLDLVNGLSPETLDRLRAVMKDLNKLPADSPDRVGFLQNPRAYLLDHELTLQASAYRIVALDFDRAAVVGAVKSDRIRAGLAVIPEGIGVFGAEVGIFLQLAI